MLTINTLPPVVTEAPALRVETCLVIDASSVDKRSWPGVRARWEESEVSSLDCVCLVSQGGSVAGGRDVGEKAKIPKATELVE